AYEHDGAAVADLLDRFSRGQATIEEAPLASLRALFASDSTDDKTILSVIRDAYARTGEILDPHTATGYRAANRCRCDATTPMITLATAHPAKFEQAIVQAGLTGAPLPEDMAGLMQLEERFTVLPAELAAVQAHITEHC